MIVAMINYPGVDPQTSRAGSVSHSIFSSGHLAEHTEEKPGILELLFFLL